MACGLWRCKAELPCLVIALLLAVCQVCEGYHMIKDRTYIYIFQSLSSCKTSSIQTWGLMVLANPNPSWKAPPLNGIIRLSPHPLDISQEDQIPTWAPEGRNDQSPRASPRACSGRTAPPGSSCWAGCCAFKTVRCTHGPTIAELEELEVGEKTASHWPHNYSTPSTLNQWELGEGSTECEGSMRQSQLPSPGSGGKLPWTLLFKLWAEGGRGKGRMPWTSCSQPSWSCDPWVQSPNHKITCCYFIAVICYCYE